jgi:hypothetical protein
MSLDIDSWVSPAFLTGTEPFTLGASPQGQNGPVEVPGFSTWDLDFFKGAFYCFTACSPPLILIASSPGSPFRSFRQKIDLLVNNNIDRFKHRIQDGQKRIF